jgi:ribonucleoside-diphosphate reductase alpha chain
LWKNREKESGMRASTALKKEISSSKLSTASEAPSEGKEKPIFDQARLVQELLSLGNAKINPQVAQLIGREVEAELKRRPAPQFSAELISDIVQFKLEEMGLIEIRRRRQKKAREGSVQAKEDEITVNLYPAQVSNPLPPSPPKTSLRLSLQALAKVKEGLIRLKNDADVVASLEGLFERVARETAEVEKKYADSANVATVAVEFFNAMANQEFYPHLPTLLGERHSPADGAEQIWIPLHSSPKSWQVSLCEAQEIWKHGKSVTFGLDTDPQGEGFSLEDFEHLLDAIEKAILDLPEDVAIPRSVGLNLSAENPRAVEFVKIALSGRYYPKFIFNLGLSDQALENFLSAQDAKEKGILALEKVLRDTWKKSEPSIVFLSRIHGEGAMSPQGVAAAVRPGGGPVLFPYEGCTLGSLNLSIVASGNDVDWVKLRRMIRTAVHFLDNLVDIADYASEKVSRQSLTYRKIGLGVMGFAELLIKLGIPYDCEDSVVLAEKLMRFIHQEAAQSSEALAKQRGAVRKGLRHASLTAIFAVPILAALADVSPGLDPLNTLVAEGKIHGLLKQISEQRKIWNPQLEAEILEKNSVRESTVAPRPLRRLFATQGEISLDWQLRVQAAFQKHSDGSIGKYLPLPESENLQLLKEVLTTAQVVGITQLKMSQNPLLEQSSIQDDEILELAEEVTVVEDTVPQLPDEIVELQSELISEALAAALQSETDLTKESTKTALLEQEKRISTPPEPRTRPELLQARNRVIQTGCGPMNVSFARDAQGPYELRAHLGKAGGCANAQNEAISRLVSLLMSVGVDSKIIYRELKGIRCPATALDRGERILSCSDAISKVFERELGLGNGAHPGAVEEETPEIPQQFFSEDEEITAVTETIELH